MYKHQTYDDRPKTNIKIKIQIKAGKQSQAVRKKLIFSCVKNDVFRKIRKSRKRTRAPKNSLKKEKEMQHKKRKFT